MIITRLGFFFCLFFNIFYFPPCPVWGLGNHKQNSSSRDYTWVFTCVSLPRRLKCLHLLSFPTLVPPPPPYHPLWPPCFPLLFPLLALHPLSPTHNSSTIVVSSLPVTMPPLVLRPFLSSQRHCCLQFLHLSHHLPSTSLQTIPLSGLSLTPQALLFFLVRSRHVPSQSQIFPFLPLTLPLHPPLSAVPPLPQLYHIKDVGRLRWR